MSSTPGFCQHCGRETGAVVRHERFCGKNPGRVVSPGSHRSLKVPGARPNTPPDQTPARFGKRGTAVRLTGRDSGVRYTLWAESIEDIRVPGGVLEAVHLAVIQRRGAAGVLEGERMAVPVSMLMVAPVDIETDRLV